VPIAMPAFYESFLWITQSFSFQNPDLHHGLLSDMFSARLYKVAASKIGVSDYKNLVNQKVHTAEELYRFMVDQFHQSRAFVLELMVVIILIIDLIWLFKGSTPI